MIPIFFIVFPKMVFGKLLENWENAGKFGTTLCNSVDFGTLLQTEIFHRVSSINLYNKQLFRHNDKCGKNYLSENKIHPIFLNEKCETNAVQKKLCGYIMTTNLMHDLHTNILIVFRCESIFIFRCCCFSF